MKAPLFLCIHWALLHLGACLQCEVCSGFGRNCSGSMETCGAGEDSCGISVAETRIVGFDTEMVTKSCMASSKCRASPVAVRFGKEMAIGMSTTCCVGDACNTASFTMPSANKTPNGRRCPACYSVFNIPCGKETFDCTGPETQCITVVGSLKMDSHSIQTTMKGCATESACNLSKGDSEAFGDSMEITTFTCRPAPGRSEPTKGPAPSVTSLIKRPSPSASGTAKRPAYFAAGTTPRPSGLLLLPILTGLFLVKLLS